MNPYRMGFVDALLGRESTNPFGWDKALSMAQYSKGYMLGAKTRKEKQITLTIEKDELCS